MRSILTVSILILALGAATFKIAFEAVQRKGILATSLPNGMRGLAPDHEAYRQYTTAVASASPCPSRSRHGTAENNRPNHPGAEYSALRGNSVSHKMGLLVRIAMMTLRCPDTPSLENVGLIVHAPQPDDHGLCSEPSHSRPSTMRAPNATQPRASRPSPRRQTDPARARIGSEHRCALSKPPRKRRSCCKP